ncbi:hypothetical protein GH714_026785 [Hevea brasiliensis]|uniref:Dynamin GTPase domain-containing protein n=1 Tax=Hevea brasiliensis TaxID=3981 RepID=A0A6A6M444_HEVBR|nr:hypothetical protein GH714_026785 [Hevea brasiliensis]
MRLQHYPSLAPELFLEFNGKIVHTDEARVADAINVATDEIAGDGKGISNTPLTLVVKKKGVPDLTMIDLPGITRVPVHGQPADIYEQIAGIIMGMSQQVDKTGERTLAVVTKSDKAPEGLLEKVTADDVNIGLGYVCVRNRIGDESYEDARKEEAKLFRSHPFSPGLINLWMPKTLSSPAEVMTAFMGIVGSAKESLKKILIRGEFDEYLDDHHMHCTARLVEMLNLYSNELHNCPESDPRRNFLMEEISVLEESRGIELPNFLPRTAFLMSVLMHHSENYFQLQLSTRRAGHNLISKMKEQSISWVTEMVEMEKMTDYTCSPDYMSEWNKLMEKQDTFRYTTLTQGYSSAEIEGIGVVEVGDIRAYQNVLHQAFDLKMRMTAYWKIVEEIG